MKFWSIFYKLMSPEACLSSVVKEGAQLQAIFMHRTLIKYQFMIMNKSSFHRVVTESYFQRREKCDQNSI